MSKFALDSSAVLAMLWAEPGSDVVAAVLPQCAISTANVAEIVTKLADRGSSAE